MADKGPFGEDKVGGDYHTTTGDILTDNADRLGIVVVDEPGGWGVAIRIDGTYSDGWEKGEVVAYYERWLRRQVEGVG